MLTFAAIRSGGGYNANHLRYPDYLDEAAQVEGAWAGKLAEKFGLQGEVTEKQFENMRTGCHPETGERLRERLHDSDRSRNLYDFTFSAPKSLSIEALLAPDSRLEEAHKAAVAEAFKVMESFAEARVRAAGLNESRITGNLIAAIYHHDTSRSLDPQLHTHCVLGNLTFDPVVNSYRALENGGIVSKLAYLTEVYRNRCASEARKAGYEIESFRDSYKNLGFELKGISKDLRDRFSQRSRERDEAIEKFRNEKGRAPSKREIAVLVRETREDKLSRIDTALVRLAQFTRLTATDGIELVTLKGKALYRGPLDPTVTVPGALWAAAEHIFERQSVASRWELLAEALRFGRGHIDNDKLVSFLDYKIQEGAYIQHGRFLTSRQNLAREQSMVESVNSGLNRCGRLGPEWATHGISEGVKRVADEALQSRDRVIAVQGLAGSEKSEALWAIWNAARAEGHKVVVDGRNVFADPHKVFALAPNEVSADALKSYGVRDPMTIREFFSTHHDSKTLKGKGGVVLVDDADLIGSKTMGQLLNLTEDLGCRVVLMSETRMTKPLDAGDALKILQRDSGIQTFGVKQSQRPTGHYRKALQALRENPVEGFLRLSKMGALNEVPVNDLYREAAKEYAKLAPNRGGKDARTVLAVSQSEDVTAFTHEIRNALRNSGKLGTGWQRKTLKPLFMSEEEKRDLANYRRGMYLVFHKGTAAAKAREVYKVKSISGGKIIATSGLLKRVTLTQKQAKCFQVYERAKIQVSIGDKLRLGKNGTSRAGRMFSFKSTFRAGEVVTVWGFDAFARIVLTDGRTLPKDYKQFTHGYVFTPNGTRGRSADQAVVLGEGTNRGDFYAAVSRAKHGVSVFTTDKRALASSIRVDLERMSAKELSQTKQRTEVERQARETHQQSVPQEGQSQRYA